MNSDEASSLFVGVVASESDATPRARPTNVYLLDATAMTTAAAAFDEFARVLSFPDYFGRNWDALDECLADLSWQPQRDHLLLFRAAEHLMEAEDVAQRDLMVDVLTEAGRTWAVPIVLGESWDRPSRRFTSRFVPSNGDVSAVLLAFPRLCLLEDIPDRSERLDDRES